MKNKILPIIVILIVICICVFIVIKITNNEKQENIIDTNKVLNVTDENLTAIIDKDLEIELIKEPLIKLSLNTSDKNQEKVTIYVEATISDGSGIKYITLPDGTEVEGSSSTYEVNENGVYSFKATTGNNATRTETISVFNIKEEKVELVTGEPSLSPSITQ